MKTGNIILSAALAADLAVAACPTLSAAQAQPDCAAWNSEAFFKVFSVGDVRACLQAGADPKARGKYGATPLHWAAREDDVGAIAALLEAGTDPKARGDSFDLTPLHFAAAVGRVDAIAALLEAGADPGARNKDDKTPFDLIAEDSPLIETPAYWRLHQARYD